jgi:Transglycosylase SLT domain
LTAGTAGLLAVIVAIAYLAGIRPGSGDNAGGAVAAVMAVPTSHAMGVLEKQRQQLIAMSAAAHTLSLVGKPSLASRQSSSLPGGSGGGGGGPSTGPSSPPPDPGTAQSIAYNMMSQFGWNPGTYFSCLNNIWTRESGWLYNAENPSGAYGIPQALPADKMASAGPNWMTDPATQIRWGLGYIQSVYGNPCSAWAFWQAHDYY